MVWLVLGVLLFAGVHLVPVAAVGFRGRLIERIGASAYKGLFTLDVLLGIVPKRVGRLLEGAADLIGLGASAVLFYYGLAATRASYADGSLLFKELVVTEWYLLAAMPLAAVLLMVEFVLRLRRGATGEAPVTEGF